MADGWATVHVATRALAPLHAGLTADSARRAVPSLRRLLGVPTVALTSGRDLLAWSGPGRSAHADAVGGHAAAALARGRTRVVPLDCPGRCPVRQAVVAPLTAGDRAVGTLGAYAGAAPPGLVRAVTEVAGWISAALDAVELRRSRSRLPGVSPHFVFNSLTAIMSLVRTDPDLAKELLQDFADVARYPVRPDADLAPLGDELAAIVPYLALEQARFDGRLRVTVRSDPDLPPVAVPVLCLRPLVDNAVRYGMERKAGPGWIAVTATVAGRAVEVSVEDDGVGMAVGEIRRALAGDGGVGAVHRRLRRAFGTGYGLSITASAGAGTRITMRAPIPA